MHWSTSTRRLLVGLLAFMCAACSTWNGYDPRTLDQLVPGVSTSADAIRLLGAPVADANIANHTRLLQWRSRGVGWKVAHVAIQFDGEGRMIRIASRYESQGIPGEVVLAPTPAVVPSPVAPTPVAATPKTSKSVNDVDAVPGLTEEGKTAYRLWLTKQLPRAFVIADDGKLYYTWSLSPKDPSDSPDPMQRAMQACKRLGYLNCKVYAVDRTVVYAP